MSSAPDTAHTGTPRYGRNRSIRSKLLSTTLLQADTHALRDPSDFEDPEPAPTIEEEEARQETIIVTGSRILREDFWVRSAIEALNPIEQFTQLVSLIEEREPGLDLASYVYGSDTVVGSAGEYLHRIGSSRTITLASGRRIPDELRSAEELSLLDMLSVFSFEQNVKLNFVHQLGETYRHYYSGAATAGSLSKRLTELFRTVADSTRIATRLANVFALRFLNQFKNCGVFQEIVRKFADPPDDVGESQTFCGNRAAYGVLSKSSRSGNSPQATKSHSILPFQPA